MLQAYALELVRVKNAGDRQTKNGGNDYLGEKPVGQDEQQEDEHTYSDQSEGEFFEKIYGLDPLILHQSKDYRHADQRNGEGETEKQGDKSQLFKGEPVDELVAENGKTGHNQCQRKTKEHGLMKFPGNTFLTGKKCQTGFSDLYYKMDLGEVY